MLADIFPGPESSTPHAFAALREELFFVADDGLSGEELWVTDGTADGAFMVLGRLFGDEGALPRPFEACGSDPTASDALGCASFRPCA